MSAMRMNDWRTMKIRYISLLAISAVWVSLTGCEQPQQATGSAVAAKVGRDAISEAEMSYAMSRLDALSQRDSSQVRDKVLEALIDQRLISNAAMRDNLDKDPQVALALAHAQRQVLSEAYMAQRLKDAAKPTDAEINDYYVQHPELFSARRIYRLQEVNLKLAASRLPEVETQLKQSRNLSEFAEWLKAQGIENKAGLSVKPAEQIPSPILAQLKDMEDGQVTVAAAGADQINILLLQASQAQPVTLEQARGAIEQVLQARVRKAQLDAEVKKLRSGETIEYGEGFRPAPSGQQAAKSVP